MNRNLVSGKPLKRLWRFFVSAHRAKAPVLMGLRASVRGLPCCWRVKLERLVYSRSSLRDRRWPPAVAVLCLGLVGGAALPAAEAAETNAPTLTLEAMVAETLASNPELNFYKAEIAAAKGER